MKYLLIVLTSFFIYAQEEAFMLHELEVIGKNNTQENNLLTFAPTVSQLKGRNFSQKKQTSLGDSLQNELGVSSTGFGPNASRPVIRGLDGDRIKVLQNGLGTIDASSQSADHAISADTLTMDQIEIVRGPMTLLYGSSAVGGIVNLVTNRIHSSFHEGFKAQTMTQYESVSSGLSNSIKIDFGKHNWMFHVDGSLRDLKNVATPVGEIKNSANRQDNLALATTKIFEKGYLGFSYNHFKTLYGVVAEEKVIIDMKQNRFELQGEWRPDNIFFQKIKFKSAQSSYHHQEVDDGMVGTNFKNKGNETRLEAINESEKLKGVIGLQSQIFDFEALGDEAFLPKVRSQQISLFAYQEIIRSNNSFRAGARLEDTDIKTQTDFKSFTSLSGSFGHEYRLNKENSFTTSFSYNERTPSFQELFANGPHLATATFEFGNHALHKEKSYALELSYKSDLKRNTFIFNIYAQRFNDYIALSPTGAVDTNSGLAISNYNQVDALFYGVELENKFNLTHAFSIKNTFDLVQAKDTTHHYNLPRISPPRLGATFEYSKGKSIVDLGFNYVFKQTKLALNETETAAYFLTNMNYSLKLSSNFSLFARLRNIFNVEARNHVSTLKDTFPLAGRNFIAGLQIQI